MGLRSYVCRLEKTLIASCAHYGLMADTSKETGVWIDNDKVAAIGKQYGAAIVSAH